MADRQVDIVLFGAGIAGLWTLNHFRSLGYSVLLLESQSIGGGQTIASQGIIHSGLKYAFTGQINALAKSISAMPDLWRDALSGRGPVDLSSARVKASSQILLIPSGLMGGLITLVTKRALGHSVHEIEEKDWPDAIKSSGFKGTLVHMDEPVLDIPSVLHALASGGGVKMIDTPEDPLGFLERHKIKANHVIFTCAGSNATHAQALHHDRGLQTQTRPLRMGLMKNAPFETYAHLVGPSDKPIATITTHTASDGSLVWYLGGAVAERAKDAPEKDVIAAALQAFKKYFPHVDFSNVQWGSLPVDRIEGQSKIDGWMPDTPTIHQSGNVFYCWPTKLTFAPMLAQRLQEKITNPPKHAQPDFSFLPDAPFSTAPWDTAQWKKDNSAAQA